MSDRIQVWIERSALEHAVAIMRGEATTRRALLPKEAGYEDNPALEGIRRLEREAEYLEQAVNWQPEKASEDEQITAIKQLIDELKEQGLAPDTWNRNLAAMLRGQFHQATSQRKSALSAWASLVDEQRINLRALKLMVERALQAGTHRIKNATLYIVSDILQNMVVDLAGIDVDEPEHYVHYSYRQNESWDYRKVLAENRVLKAQIKQIEGQKPDGEPVDDEVPL